MPKDFRVDTEHLCRSTLCLSLLDTIRTLLRGVAQSVNLFTELVRGAHSASGHLAQRERRVWVFPVRRILPLVFGGSGAVEMGQASPCSLLLVVLLLLLLFLLFILLPLPLLPELLLIDFVHVSFVVCVFFLASPGLMSPRGNVGQKQIPPPSFWLAPPGGVHSQKKITPPPPGVNQRRLR